MIWRRRTSGAACGIRVLPGGQPGLGARAKEPSWARVTSELSGTGRPFYKRKVRGGVIDSSKVVKLIKTKTEDTIVMFMPSVGLMLAYCFVVEAAFLVPPATKTAQSYAGLELITQASCCDSQLIMFRLW